MLEMTRDDVGGGGPEIEALAARDDGGEDFVRLGGGEDEFDVRRGFLERFEKGVEGSGGQHVNLIDVNDAEAAGGGRKAHRFKERANFVDLVIGGAIDFEDIERAALGNLDAGGIFGIEVDGRSVGTIESL